MLAVRPQVERPTSPPDASAQKNPQETHLCAQDCQRPSHLPSQVFFEPRGGSRAGGQRQEPSWGPTLVARLQLLCEACSSGPHSPPLAPLRSAACPPASGNAPPGRRWIPHGARTCLPPPQAGLWVPSPGSSPTPGLAAGPCGAAAGRMIEMSWSPPCDLRVERDKSCACCWGRENVLLWEMAVAVSQLAWEGAEAPPF